MQLSRSLSDLATNARRDEAAEQSGRRDRATRSMLRSTAFRDAAILEIFLDREDLDPLVAQRHQVRSQGGRLGLPRVAERDPAGSWAATV